MHVQQMISSHPQRGHANEALIRCIEECYDCAQTCTACADACLGEPTVQEMTQCIRTCLDCADVCLTTGALATRRTGSNVELLGRMLQLCEDACRVCARECGRHAEMITHCRICADACLRCEVACREAAASMSPTLQ
ncbi:four-helix bundle copper-binding protein [Phenylobacterium sp. LjRoot219]|uniref:four-helix bundle copper-binding protein n=1 Tax=Phenylobacterium sp. LjRoot219 TaxID=3342283 RepID=UPI003ECEE6FE